MACVWLIFASSRIYQGKAKDYQMLPNLCCSLALVRIQAFALAQVANKGIIAI